MKNRIVYADHSATTAVRPEVKEAMLPYLEAQFGNPSSIYEIAQQSKAAIEAARTQVAKGIGAKAREIYFTSGGTEADNWAIKGTAEIYRAKNKTGGHIITSAVEHHAVLHTCEFLETQGFRVTYLPVDAEGTVSIQALKEAFSEDTILVSIMIANNEIGTINPIAEIGQICREHKVPFHVDAVQALGTLSIDVEAMQIDMLSMSAHKLYGPKGVGALYVRKGIRLTPLMHGGAQESKKRAGTENVPGIVGFGKAVELATADMEERGEKLKVMRDYLIDTILEKVPHVRLNGSRTNRLPGHVNFSFSFIEGESMLMLLDMNGIYASSGSACTSGSLDPSHVLMAIGLPHEIAHGSLRLTFGRENTMEDMEYIIEKLPPIVERLREMSPLYADYLKNGNQ